jgi:hypothetical protein
MTAATYYSATAFLDAWKRGVELAGDRWFGSGRYTPEQLDTASKYDLAPRYDDIVANLGILSSGEAAFLVALYSFYNGRVAGRLFERLGITGLAHVSQRLDEPRLRVIADLLVSYEGW